MNPRIHRRALLKLAGTAFAATTFSPSLIAAAKDNPWKLAVGLNGFQSGTHKYKKTYPIWEVLDFATRHKFNGVELVQDWPQGGYLASTETQRISALRRLYDQYNLQVFSIQLGADGAFAPDESARKQWLETFHDRVRFAQALGCDAVGLWPGGGLRGQTIDEAIQRLSRSFREAGKIAADHGLLAAFEIEPPFVFNTETHYLRILHGADHPALKGIYDPSHFDLMNGSTGRPHEMLQRIGVRNIGYVHLTDTDGTLRDGGTSKHVACGDGHANVPESLRMLKEGRFRGWIMIDAWEVPDPYDACVKGKQAIDAFYITAHK